MYGSEVYTQLTPGSTVLLKTIIRNTRASTGIPHNLRKPKVRYRIHNSSSAECVCLYFHVYLCI